MTAATAGTRPSLDPFAESWATLLGTRKRDGTWVDTPVNLAVHDGRAYFGTPSIAGKVKRLRNFDEVRVAPCTPRGRPTGAPVAARARRLEGDEAEVATRLLERAYPFVYRRIVPLELRLRRATNVVYELTDFTEIESCGPR